MKIGRAVKFGLPGLILVATGVIIMLKPDTTQKNTSHLPSFDGYAAVATQRDAENEAVSTPEATDTHSQSTTPVKTNTTTPVSTPIVSVNYGEIADNPGSFAVFDKTAVMTAAGIPLDLQSSADAVINRLSGWVYKKPISYVGGKHEFSLCNPNPYNKMDYMNTKPEWADWRTNPVSQMAWCHNWVTAVWGSWDKVPADQAWF